MSSTTTITSAETANSPPPPPPSVPHHPPLALDAPIASVSITPETSPPAYQAEDLQENLPIIGSLEVLYNFKLYVPCIHTDFHPISNASTIDILGPGEPNTRGVLHGCQCTDWAVKAGEGSEGDELWCETDVMSQSSVDGLGGGYEDEEENWFEEGEERGEDEEGEDEDEGVRVLLGCGEDSVGDQEEWMMKMKYLKVEDGDEERIVRVKAEGGGDENKGMAEVEDFETEEASSDDNEVYYLSATEQDEDEEGGVVVNDDIDDMEEEASDLESNELAAVEQYETLEHELDNYMPEKPGRLLPE